MPSELTLLNAQTTQFGLSTIDVLDGRIVSITPRGRDEAVSATGSSVSSNEWADHPFSAVVDLSGALVIPSLVNGHAHLDKTFIGGPWQPHIPGGSVADRITAEKSRRTAVEASTVERARALATLMVQKGTGAVRTHVDVDDEIGLSSLEALLQVREEMRGRLRIEIIAFPQSGILSSPGVDRMLDSALRAGADGIGGLDPLSFDRDSSAHLDIVFGLAERHGVPVDIHLHDTGREAVAQYEEICARTIAHGMQGSVVISHAWGLGSVAPDEAKRLGALFAHAGVAIMTNGPAGPMPPVLTMRAEGAIVFAGSDNIRDAWWPYGTGDMLEVARTVAYQSNFRTDAELEVALSMITIDAAHAIGLADYGLREGARADLLIAPGAAAELVTTTPAWHHVLHGGRLVSTSRSVVTNQHSTLAMSHAEGISR